ncbi:Hpc2p NDAI_0F01810 [Naumovozyma dairenensis CBS 421]|uniref:Hpc2-related domain-containing protein n=1 Tax=Naumovozyma dairenensis (strain ATCC 10597 / BCRC 20456 / CBS 421 / NBRC 0211 / NRRL Y-12639) TaxID=1071378 RepID=G0WCI9_NAUDC|nr:hypothetical protein NDAI_0F01810 [Naumovozyma dairenensis CBS 421]CCD25500.1 hypothetical protein NDAI_0F01810 [Naumovozyma dairenensis CBS 421]
MTAYKSPNITADMAKSVYTKREELATTGKTLKRKAINTENSNPKREKKASATLTTGDINARRIPNIAQELAKNRNFVKTSSPSLSPSSDSNITTASSFSTSAQTILSNIVPKNEDQGQESNVKPTVKQRSKPKVKPKPKEGQPSTETSKPKTTIKKPSVTAKAIKPKPVVQSIEHKENLPNKSLKISSLLTSDTDESNTTNIPIKPKVILPTQSMSASKLVVDNLQDTIIARTPTPVNVEPTQVLTKKPAHLKRSQSSLAVSLKRNIPTAVEKAQKSNSMSTPSITPKKKSTKKKPLHTSKQTEVKPDDTVAQTTPKSAPRLVPPPPLKSASLVDVFENPSTKSIENSEANGIILDIPLYSTRSNDYLDENGTVVFNVYRLLQENASTKEDIESLKKMKRNLLTQLNDKPESVISTGRPDDYKNNNTLEEEDEDGAVTVIRDEEDEMLDDEEATETSPKKRSHPMKGKSMIGKYDFDDPFIDDTELLWEEQQASTKDGFFVYFGPLVEKGQYARLEKTSTTTKRGSSKK